MSRAVKEAIESWDPDFTKVTPAEQKALEEAVEDMKEAGTISHDDINWD